MNSRKVPGPDGYNAAIFNANWELVAEDIVAAVKSFFRTGKLFKGMEF